MVYACLIAFTVFIFIGDAAFDGFCEESASVERELACFVAFLLSNLGAFCSLVVLASSLLGVI